MYYIDPEGLGELRRWLDEFWGDALASFAREMNAANKARGSEEKMNRTDPDRAGAQVRGRRRHAGRSLRVLHRPGSIAGGRSRTASARRRSRNRSSSRSSAAAGTRATRAAKKSTVGHVRVWQPGERFVVGWEINANWKPESRVALTSEVEVRFIAEAPTAARASNSNIAISRRWKATAATRCATPSTTAGRASSARVRKQSVPKETQP